MAKEIPFKEERKRMKCLHELNQNLKKLYTKYIINEAGCVIGEPTKPEFKRSCYITNIHKDIGGLNNIVFVADNIYVSFRDSKPTHLDISDGKVTLIDLSNKTECIIGSLENREIFLAGNIKAPDVWKDTLASNNFTKEIFNVILENISSYSFTEDDVEKLIAYEKFSFNNEEYRMDIAIGLFPLLKKFKNLMVYIKNIDDEKFDAVFVSSLGENRVYHMYTFMKV